MDAKPHKEDAPLTHKSVHADEDDADSLSAANHGPSLRPTRK